MKQNEFQNCAACGKGMAAENLFFYRVKIEQFVLDTRAIQRQHGLEQFFGAAPALAAVMGPNEDLAKGMGERILLLCGHCGITGHAPVAVLVELAGETMEQPDG